MSKKKKNRVRIQPVTTKNRHHICFQGRYWNYGYAKAIRNAFVRQVPIIYHQELHSILETVPVPSGELCKKAWIKYQKDKDVIDSYDVCRAIAWLYVNIPDMEFRKAMQVELNFFAEKLLQFKRPP